MTTEVARSTATRRRLVRAHAVQWSAHRPPRGRPDLCGLFVERACGLFVFGLPILSSFGIAGLGVVLLCMAAAVTLLPATLAAVGGKIPPAAPVADVAGRFYRLTRWVQGHAVAVGAAAVVVLVLLGVPFLGARFEIGDARTLPRSSEVRDVALTLADRFPARGTDPVTVIADTDSDSAEFVAWFEQLSALPGVVGTAIRPDTPPGLTVVDVTPAGTSQGREHPSSSPSYAARSRAFDTEVGGIAAELIDIKARLSERLPLAALMVVAATLVLLFLMTGSVIVPIKAVLMNILSLGASFGALVWIFQEGHLAGLLGFDSVGALDLWMPVLILIFAFGLSMDYEVFLLSRIKEVHDETGDSDLAVAVGLQRSGRIITSAAFLIVIVFAGFAAGEVLAIKQLGVGLAIAVLVDATIVRTLLVPATMKLLGERNWWAPAPLRRFHQRFGLHEAPSPAPHATEADPTSARPPRTPSPSRGRARGSREADDTSTGTAAPSSTSSPSRSSSTTRPTRSRASPRAPAASRDGVPARERPPSRQHDRLGHPQTDATTRFIVEV